MSGRTSIWDRRDLWAGFLLVAVGGFFAYQSLQYEFGAATTLGPGFFPYWLSMILCVLGVIISLSSVAARGTTAKVPSVHWPSTLLIIGSIVAFGILLKFFGLLVALLALVVLSSMADPGFGWRGTVVTALVLMVLCWAIFVKGLELPLPLLPPWLEKV